MNTPILTPPNTDDVLYRRSVWFKRLVFSNYIIGGILLLFVNEWAGLGLLSLTLASVFIWNNTRLGG